jgi:hypothetical protein
LVRNIPLGAVRGGVDRKGSHRRGRTLRYEQTDHGVLPSALLRMWVAQYGHSTSAWKKRVSDPGRETLDIRIGKYLFGITSTSAGLVFVALWFLVLPPNAEASPRFLYFLKGHVVHRLSFPDLRSETILVFAEGEDPEGPEKVQASAGKVVWVRKEGNVTSLFSWDGSGKSRLPLERHVSMEEGIFGIEYGKDGEISRVVPRIGDTYLGAFLLSPDGSKIAWNVNIIADLSPENAGTSHQRHLIYRADVDGRNRRLVLEQNYDVTGIFADATEDRRLFRWSRNDPEWIYFTRFEGKQLGGAHVGLYRCNIRTGVLEVVDGTIEEVLALSEDETLGAYTPNEGSCCGGINQTNNQVIVKNLRTGKESVVFDEWGEFANKPLEPGEEGIGEEIMPVSAFFSPDGKRLAITVRRWSSSDGVPSRFMAIVRKIGPGGRGGYMEGRCALGWPDNRGVLLGECHVSNVEKRSFRSLYLYDVDKHVETLLPVEEISPIGVGR